MREFENFSDQNNKFLTAQNCRADIIGEIDAISQYEKHYFATDDPSAKAAILDIMNEEKVHVGQLFALLFTLDPVAKTQFEKGFNEFMNEDLK